MTEHNVENFSNKAAWLGLSAYLVLILLIALII
jgi:hypothetical protein